MVIIVIFENSYFTRPQLRCGGIRSNQFITNFPHNVSVKKNLKIY